MGHKLGSMENHSTTWLLEEIDRLQAQLAELQFSEIERKRAEQINQTLFSISNAVNTTFNLDELYDSIHGSLSRIIDVTHFYIALYDKEHDLIEFPYNTDEIDTDVDKITHASQSKSLTNQVIQTGSPLLLTTQEHETLTDLLDIGIVGIPSAVWLGVPLIVKGGSDRSDGHAKLH